MSAAKLPELLGSRTGIMTLRKQHSHGPTSGGLEPPGSTIMTGLLVVAG